MILLALHFFFILRCLTVFRYIFEFPSEFHHFGLNIFHLHLFYLHYLIIFKGWCFGCVFWCSKVSNIPDGCFRHIYFLWSLLIYASHFFPFTPLSVFVKAPGIPNVRQNIKSVQKILLNPKLLQTFHTNFMIFPRLSAVSLASSIFNIFH